MKIEKAIKEIDHMERGKRQQGLFEQADALKLGIEALKWMNQWRGSNSSLANVRLPSEIKE